jgi:hypothetical protein
MYSTKPIVLGLVLLFSQSFVNADMDQCIEEVESLHEENQLLPLATIRLAQEYNETCHEEGLCTTYLDDETRAYFESEEYSQNPTIPDVPIIADVDAEFAGFEEHANWDAYVQTCEQTNGGKVCRMDVDIDFKGAAVDLVEIDLDLNTYHMPFCLTDACDGEDLELVLEGVAKKFVLQQADLEQTQQNLVKTLSLNQVCLGLGISTCQFAIKNVDCSGNPITSPVILANVDSSDSSDSGDPADWSSFDETFSGAASSKAKYSVSVLTLMSAILAFYF